MFHLEIHSLLPNYFWFQKTLWMFSHFFNIYFEWL